MTPSDASQPTAELIAARLETLRSPDELEKYKRYFKFGPGDYGEGDTFMGVRMGVRAGERVRRHALNGNRNAARK